MNLRLVLLSSCTLLLSSLSLNAQQEREARLRLTTAVPALAAKDAKPEFGPNVLIFDPSMPSQAIQKKIDAVYATQQHNGFGQQRNALLFLPGDYSVDGLEVEYGVCWRGASAGRRMAFAAVHASGAYASGARETVSAGECCGRVQCAGSGAVQRQRRDYVPRRGNSGRDNSDCAVLYCAPGCGYGGDGQRAACPKQKTGFGAGGLLNDPPGSA